MPSLFKAFRRRNSQNSGSAAPAASSTLLHSPSVSSNTSKLSSFSFSPAHHRHQYAIRVALLDGRVIQLNYTKNDDASHLFNRVCDEEQIGVEKDWFGLRFIDSHGQPYWLDMHKNARAQLKKGLPHSVHYRSLLENGSSGGMNTDNKQMKVSPSKSSIASNYSYASATLPRQSSANKHASPSTFDKQYNDTESFVSQSNAVLGSLNESLVSTNSAAGWGDVSELQLRFKFYPQNPTQALQEESTRYALVKQLRSDFRQGKLTGSVSDESKFIACLLQADLGNLAEQQANLSALNNSVVAVQRTMSPMPSSAHAFRNSDDVNVDNVGMQPAVAINHISPIPDIYREMNHFGNTGEEKILAAWENCHDATPSRSDEMLLQAASQLESYGIADATPVQDQQNNRDAMLSCNYAGIFIRNATRRINAFAWQKIQKVNLDGKLIVVYVLDSESSVGGAKASNGGLGSKSATADEISKFAYKCRSGSGAKALWRFILENKIFYSAPTAKGIAPVRSGRIGPLSFHRRVTLRFTGRTSREAIEQGEQAKRKQKSAEASGSASPTQPPVQRVPLLATYALPDTLRSTGTLSHHGSDAAGGSSTGSLHARQVAADGGEEQWSQHVKHDLMNQLHDRKLKQSMEAMQAQTYNIADEFEDIRSPNTVGLEASSRPKFQGDISMEDNEDNRFFQLQPLNANIQEQAYNEADELHRFCTVGDVPSHGTSLDHPRASSTPLRGAGKNPVVVLVNGRWVDPDTGAPFIDHPGAGRLSPESDRDDERTTVYKRNRRHVVDEDAGGATTNSFYANRERLTPSPTNSPTRKAAWFARRHGYSKMRVRCAFAAVSLLGLLMSIILLSIVVFETCWLDSLLGAVGIHNVGRKINTGTTMHNYREPASSHQRHQVEQQGDRVEEWTPATVPSSSLQQLLLNYKGLFYDRAHDLFERLVGKHFA